jgi:hypothetical protein
MFGYGGSFLFLDWAMWQTPGEFAHIMAHVPSVVFLLFPFEAMWTHARAGTLRNGDMAPEFRLVTFDHKNEVQLSSFRGRQPVVLVFGSYT